MTVVQVLATVLLVAGMALMTVLALVPMLLEREAERVETAPPAPAPPARMPAPRPPAATVSPLPVRRAA